MGFGGIMKKVTGMAANMVNQSAQQPAVQSVEQPQQQSGGLAAQSAAASGFGSSETVGAPTTSVSGVTNPAANQAMFGNRTNGSGMMNGQMMQGFNGGLASMANNGFGQGMPIQGPGQYDVIGGAKLI